MHHDELQDPLTGPCYVQVLRRSTNARASADPDPAVLYATSAACTGRKQHWATQYYTPVSILKKSFCLHVVEEAEGERQKLGSIARPGDGQFGIHRCQLQFRDTNKTTGWDRLIVAPRRPWGPTRIGRRPCSSAAWTTGLPSPHCRSFPVVLRSYFKHQTHT